MASGSEKYQADRENSQDEASESSKKAAKVAAKGAADYFTGGKGGAVVDKLADTKLGNEILDKAGKVIDKTPGLNKAAQKLNDSGALDAADTGLSMMESGGASKGEMGGSTTSQIGNNTTSVDSNISSLDSNKKSSKSDSSSEVLESDTNESEDSLSTNSLKLNGALEIFGLGGLRTKLIIFGGCVLLFFAFGIIAIIAGNDENENFKDNNEESTSICSTISMNNTTLSESEFTESLRQKANLGGGYKIFYENASTIYNLSVNNNINPEMVVLRAVSEGFSPGGSTNNYWGLGCTNTGGIKACINYSTFSQGVLGYINNISKYNTVEEMMSKYAYIGSYWYSPGGSGIGGCYYFPYIKKYLSSSRSLEVQSACSRNCSGSSCLKTTDEDQRAYSKWQVEKMSNTRKIVFNLDEDKCDSNSSVNGGTGSEIVQYAINTFDSFSYSQANRMSSFAVDCSSLVWRAYHHFNINFGTNSYAPTAQGEYNWCQNKGKVISEKDLQPGDLIFWYHGTSTIQHVAIYVGNNQQFAAHSSRYAQPDQVSVTAYNKGSGDRFCRPY